MDLFEYALRAYNLLFDLVQLILSPFLGPLRYIAVVGLLLILGVGWVGYVILRRRRHPRSR